MQFRMSVDGSFFFFSIATPGCKFKLFSCICSQKIHSGGLRHGEAENIAKIELSKYLKNDQKLHLPYRSLDACSLRATMSWIDTPQPKNTTKMNAFGSNSLPGSDQNRVQKLWNIWKSLKIVENPRSVPYKIRRKIVFWARQGCTL